MSTNDQALSMLCNVINSILSDMIFYTIINMVIVISKCKIKELICF